MLGECWYGVVSALRIAAGCVLGVPMVWCVGTVLAVCWQCAGSVLMVCCWCAGNVLGVFYLCAGRVSILIKVCSR